MNLQITSHIQQISRTLLILVLMILGNSQINAQSVVNGNFNSTNSNWGCNPEANNWETTYGGSNSSNRVAEVDNSAGLCQTINGFTVGYLYELTFDCSRRTTCGPTLQTMDVTVDGGALSVGVYRNGGGFGFSSEQFFFIATDTSHTIQFNGTVSGTCGLIVDNIAVSFISALPVDLLDFSANRMNKTQVELTWATGSEENNDYFTIERSLDGINWIEVDVIAGAGNSQSILNYSTTDYSAVNEKLFYRLKQTDFDLQYTYSDVVVVSPLESINQQITAYPNPTHNVALVELNTEGLTEVQVLSAIGMDVTNQIILSETSKGIRIDFSSLAPGIYHIITAHGNCKIQKW